MEFIEFILQKYPPKRLLLKKNKTIREQWNENSKYLVEILSAGYNPDIYRKNTEQEKLYYTIYHTISTEINAILYELTPESY